MWNLFLIASALVVAAAASPDQQPRVPPAPAVAPAPVSPAADAELPATPEIAARHAEAPAPPASAAPVRGPVLSAVAATPLTPALVQDTAPPPPPAPQPAVRSPRQAPPPPPPPAPPPQGAQPRTQPPPPPPAPPTPAEPASPRAPRAPRIARAERPAASSKGVNIRIDATVIESRGEQTVGRKTVSATVMDGENGFVRSTVIVPAQSPIDSARKDMLRGVLNMDVRAWLRDDGRVTAYLTLESQGGAIDLGERGSGSDAGIRQSVAVVLEQNKPLVVAQSADAVGDRRLALEVTATLLK
jgi:outer membrane biosynthesis protein TonB